MSRTADVNDRYARMLVLLSTLARLAGWRNGMSADRVGGFDPRTLVANLGWNNTMRGRLEAFGLMSKNNVGMALSPDAQAYLNELYRAGFFVQVEGNYRLTAAGVLALEMAVVRSDDMV